MQNIEITLTESHILQQWMSI